jgi:hypothetical protein
MARHTHPTPRAKHSRAHTRDYRERYIEKRWQRMKRGEWIRDAAYGWMRPDNGFTFGEWGIPWSEEEARIAEIVGESGPVVFVEAETARRLPMELRDALSYSFSRRLQYLPKRLTYRGRDWDGDNPAERFHRAYRKCESMREVEEGFKEMEFYKRWRINKMNGLDCTSAICICGGCMDRWVDEQIWEDYLDGLIE